MISSRA